MKTFTFERKDDTLLYKLDRKLIVFVFYANPITEEEDAYEFPYSQDELFDMLRAYRHEGSYPYVFDAVTPPALEALWKALRTMHNKGVVLDG